MSKNLVAVLSAMLFISVTALSGCGGAASTKSGEPKGEQHSAEHAHAEEGPHHGQLIELGKEEYHAELLHDDATHTVTIYLLDSAAKKAVAASAKELTVNIVADGKPAQFALPAKPQADDAAGESSRFELSDEALCTALDAKGAKGRLSVTIGEKSFSGAISAHDHGHEHDHK
ncbi:MAG TPA: hypothetical protein VL096_14400 [Pirellulaceae bacterium]|nr:hypothetical protein [Pirellulaceae bacterium]